MRQVRLEELTPDMKLGRSIYHYNNLLLRVGTDNIQQYVPSLRKLGISFVYIDDDLSKDIEIEDIVSESTRVKCKDILQQTLKTFSKQGSVNLRPIYDVSTALLEDALSNPHVLISLTDIGTTDDSTLVHSINTAIYCLLIGRELQLPTSDLKKLTEGALLHDVGKTLIDPDVLYKTAPLTREEFSQVQMHATLGYNILKKQHNFSELTCVMALQHHERLDGSGYPQGLTHNKIHPFAQILAIADMYDALTAERCYRSALSNYESYKILVQDSNTKINAEYLSLLLKRIAIYPNGSKVKLSDGTSGIVKQQNPNMPFRPIVRVIDTSTNSPKKLYDINLLEKLNITIINE